jgi:hypothetical protein
MRAFGAVIVSALLASSGVLQAQTRTPRYEVGGQASLLRLSDFDSTRAGIGGRFTFNISRWASLEAEGNFFPQDDVLLPGAVADFRVTHFRTRTDAFAGAKVGYRAERFGLFAKLRPGVTVLRERDQIGSCQGDVCALALLIRPEYRSELALDVGGVLEFYPSGGLVVRVDLGDTIIWHRSMAPPCWSNECTSNNFTSKFGFGFRF